MFIRIILLLSLLVDQNVSVKNVPPGTLLSAFQNGYNNGKIERCYQEKMDMRGHIVGGIDKYIITNKNIRFVEDDKPEGFCTLEKIDEKWDDQGGVEVNTKQYTIKTSRIALDDNPMHSIAFREMTEPEEERKTLASNGFAVLRNIWSPRKTNPNYEPRRRYTSIFSRRRPQERMVLESGPGDIELRCISSPKAIWGQELKRKLIDNAPKCWQKIGYTASACAHGKEIECLHDKGCQWIPIQDVILVTELFEQYVDTERDSLVKY